MKKISILFIFCSLFAAGTLSAQCDAIVNLCQKHFDDTYISDGQAYWAMLSGTETAEFQTIFFGGNRYRIGAQGGLTDGNLIFRILDPEGRVLFNSATQGNAPYWDFGVESTMTVTIEAQLDPNKISDGCAVLLIGFRR